MKSSVGVLEELMKIAKQKGVEADALITQTQRDSVSCRMQKINSIESSFEENICLRVMAGKRQACVSTNQAINIPMLFEKALTLAKASPEDPNVSLFVDSEPELQSLSIFDTQTLTQEDLIDKAKCAEEIALSQDKIINSEGAESEVAKHTTFFGNSNGFISSYSRSSFYNSVSVIAKDKESMERGSDYSFVCNLNDLQKPEELGLKAATKAKRKLNPQKVKTSNMPVVFDSEVAGSLLKGFADAISGIAISNGTSFLAKKMQGRIFHNPVNIIDNPKMAKGVRSYPFDDEGVNSRKISLVKDGKLNNWLLDVYSANKLNLDPSGHSRRSKDGKIMPAYSNLYMEAGTVSPEFIISQINRGILVTDIFGFGTNIVTGDYSHGASGFLIEDGEVSVPVNEFTIASNMPEMFMSLLPANDLNFNRLINAPTIVIAKMTIAGT